MLGGYDNPADRLKQWEDDLASGKIKENTNDRMQYTNLKYLVEKMKSQNIRCSSRLGLGRTVNPERIGSFLS